MATESPPWNESSSSDSGWELDWRRGLIPLSLFILAVLHFGFNAPLWVLVAFCMWIPVYYLGVPYYKKRRWEDFEQTFARHFQRGEHKTLLEKYRRQWFLRRFGPRAQMLSKLGLIYSALEKNGKAEDAFERAVAEYDDRVPDQLRFNLANVKFELGKHDEAMSIYLSLHNDSPYQQAARTRMALIDLQKGARTEQAIEQLENQKDRVSEPLRDKIEQALAEHG